MPPTTQFNLMLKNWKGSSGKVELARRNYIHGRNGAGKSRILEALHFAHVGKLPSRYAQTNQAVGDLFGASGSVELEDRSDHFAQDPAWIRRTLSRSGASVKIKADTSDSRPGTATADTSKWETANPLLIDFGSFEGLKPEAKGRYILELCREEGSKPVDIMDKLRRHAAKALAGPTAEPQIFQTPDVSLKGTERPIAERMLRGGGVFELLESYVDVRKRPSVVCVELLEAAKVELNAARETKRNTEKTIATLKEKGEMQVPRDADLRRYEARTARLGETLRKADASRVEIASLTTQLEEAIEANDRQQELVIHLNESVEKLEGSIPEQVVIDEAYPAELKTLRNAATEAERQRVKAEDTIAAASLQAKRRTELEKDMARHLANLQAHKASFVARLLDLLVDLPVDAYPTVAEIKSLADRISRDQGKVAANFEKAVAEVQKLVAAHDRETARLGDVEAIEASIPSLKEAAESGTAEFKTAEKEWEAAKCEAEKASGLYVAAVGALAAETASRTAEMERARGTAGKVGGTERRLREAVACSKATGRDDVEGVKEALDTATATMQEYRAAIKVKEALEEISNHALYAEDDIAAWTIAIEAVKEARDDYVREAAGVLLSKANEVYKTAFPKEEIGIILETPTGKTTCRFFVRRGEVRIDERALSVGEWCLVLSAFMLSTMSRSVGRRMLLVEAQSLDPVNLSRLLHMLSGPGASLVAVASTILPAEMPGGEDGVSHKWRLIEIEKQGVDKREEALDIGKQKASVSEERYVVETKEWYNKRIKPLVDGKSCKRVGRQLREAIKKAAKSHPNWREVVEMNIVGNPGAKDMHSIDLMWFTKRANLQMWERHEFASIATMEPSQEMPGLPMDAIQ